MPLPERRSPPSYSVDVEDSRLRGEERKSKLSWLAGLPVCPVPTPAKPQEAPPSQTKKMSPLFLTSPSTRHPFLIDLRSLDNSTGHRPPTSGHSAIVSLIEGHSCLGPAAGCRQLSTRGTTSQVSSRLFRLSIVELLVSSRPPLSP